MKLIRSLDLIVIDEISMVRSDLLDAVDSVLRGLRHSDKPFGGVQMLMIGDIHQLAPVAKQEEWELLKPYYKSVYFSIVMCCKSLHISALNLTMFIDRLTKTSWIYSIR